MSKVYHWQFVTAEEDEHVIDSNDMIRKRMEEYERNIQREKEYKKAKLKDEFYASITQDEE